MSIFRSFELGFSSFIGYKCKFAKTGLGSVCFHCFHYIYIVIFSICLIRIFIEILTGFQKPLIPCIIDSSSFYWAYRIINQTLPRLNILRLTFYNNWYSNLFLLLFHLLTNFRLRFVNFFFHFVWGMMFRYFWRILQISIFTLIFIIIALYLWSIR